MTLTKIPRRALVGQVETADIADEAVEAGKLPQSGVNLFNIRKLLRLGPDLLDFGAFSDMTAAINAVETAAASDASLRRVLVPAGTWVQDTAPGALTRGVLFDGQERSAVTVQVNHTGAAFHFTGENGGGGGAQHMFISATSAVNPHSAVRAEANVAGYSPDGLRVHDLWITYQSTGRWSYGVFLDGAARNPGTGLQGLRDCYMNDIITFGTTTFALHMRNMKVLHVSNCLLNGVGGVNKFALIGNSSADKDRNDGCTLAGIVGGEFTLNNTNALTGFITPQGGFSISTGISNSSLLVPPAYHDIGTSTTPFTGLTLPT